MRSRNSVQATAHSGPSTSPKQLIRVALILAVSTVLASSTGCMTLFDNVGQSYRYSNTFNDAANKFRFRSMSSKSWHKRKHTYCNEACLSDFCAGYRQGYEDVANGGNGCTPNFPPRDYWDGNINPRKVNAR